MLDHCNLRGLDVARRRLLAFFVVVVAVGAAVLVLRKKPPARHCEEKLTRADLDRSLELGEQFMLVHQKQAGNFDYEYDWKTKENSSDDNAPRQSGALWGLGLFLADHGAAHASPELVSGLKRGIAFFDNGSRYPVYPNNEKTGGTGMAALVTLAMIEWARAYPNDDRKRVNEYVSFVAGLVRPDGLWPGDYSYADGTGTTPPSPYSDGEALLCLVQAMKVLGRTDLAPVIERAANEGHRINVVLARAAKADSDTTKGYYQWSSMAYYELATSDLASKAPYGEWLLDEADWILNVHHVLGRPRNTGYAFEGLVSAYAWAKRTNNPRAADLACSIHEGLGGLLGWQVGHPRATALGSTDDKKALGGVQNHATEPPLRIDTVQHQMHATMLARQYLLTP